MLLKKLADKYIFELKTNNFSKNTINEYMRNLNIYLSFLKNEYNVFAPDKINKENTKEFTKYVLKLKNQNTNNNLKESSKQAILKCAKKFLIYLFNEEYIEKDYTFIFKIKFKTEKIIKNIVTEKEIKTIFESVNTRTLIGFRDRTIFELVYNTGIRLSEVCNLKVYDINFENHRIFIREGKNKKDRIVPIGNYLEKYLIEYLKKVRPILIQNNINIENVFVNFKGLKLNKNTLGTMIYKQSKKTGIKFSCHTFRHTCATHLLKNGANIVYIQKLLGHEKISTTQIYTKVYPKELKHIIEKYHPRSNIDIDEEKIVIPTKGRKLENLKAVKLRLKI